MKAAADLSAAGRQGLISSAAHPLIAARAFGKQLKSLVSPKAYEKFKRDLDLHPYIEMAEASKLFLASLANESSVTEREENFMSRLFGDADYFKNAAAEKVRKAVTLHVRASERAYLTYLDDLRINVFAQLAEEVHKSNVRKGRPDDPEQYEGIAAFVNYSTGRGNLGKFSEAAPYLNASFFSARYWASRLQVMNPVFYATLPPGARKVALKEFGKFLGAMAALGIILKALGADIEYDDPDHPDMLKVRIPGGYVYTIDAGLLKHLKYAYRMAMAGSEGDARQMGGLTTRYFRSSASPAIGAAINSVEGKNYIGEPTSAKEEALGLLTPISVDNLKDSIAQDGTIGLMKQSPEIFGIGVTRYRSPVEIQKKIDAVQKSDLDPKEKARRIKAWATLKTRAVKYARK